MSRTPAAVPAGAASTAVRNNQAASRKREAAFFPPIHANRDTRLPHGLCEDIGSHFVCRVRDNSAYQVIEDRSLQAEAKAAGIVRDRIVWRGGRHSREELRQPLRLIQIACKPHHKRSGHAGRSEPEQGEVLLIATDLLDVPAEVVALIYRKRWTVELFFGFFKYVLGCRHLLSHRANGIEIQVYLAILVCMLIALWTGKKPTLRTMEMIRFYLIGWADLDELHLRKVELVDEVLILNVGQYIGASA